MILRLVIVVSNFVSSPSDSDNAASNVGLQPRPSRPKRIVQPNRRHVGPDWTQ
jgi:hypothetical protein